jgi:hypothetical protein
LPEVCPARELCPEHAASQAQCTAGQQVAPELQPSSIGLTAAERAHRPGGGFDALLCGRCHGALTDWVYLLWHLRVATFEIPGLWQLAEISLRFWALAAVMILWRIRYCATFKLEDSAGTQLSAVLYREDGEDFFGARPPCFVFVCLFACLFVFAHRSVSLV